MRIALELTDDATALATLAELQIAETQLDMAMSLWSAGVAAAEIADAGKRAWICGRAAR